MRKILSVVAALALLSFPALAEEAPQLERPKAPTPDEQVVQAQMRFLSAQSDYASALARKFQAENIEAAKREAAKDAWWASWWKGMYPETAAAAPSAPKPPDAK